MAVKLRLTRMGNKKRAFYRVVAINNESRRDGRPLEYLGFYNPMVEPAEIKIDMDGIPFMPCMACRASMLDILLISPMPGI